MKYYLDVSAIGPKELTCVCVCSCVHLKCLCWACWCFNVQELKNAAATWRIYTKYKPENSLYYMTQAYSKWSIFGHDDQSDTTVTHQKLLNCLLLQFLAWYQCTRCLKHLVTPTLLSAMRTAQRVSKKSWMIGRLCVFSNSCFCYGVNKAIIPLQWRKHLPHPCANWWWVAVAAHFSCKGRMAAWLTLC